MKKPWPTKQLAYCHRHGLAGFRLFAERPDRGGMRHAEYICPECDVIQIFTLPVPEDPL